MAFPTRIAQAAKAIFEILRAVGTEVAALTSVHEIPAFITASATILSRVFVSVASLIVVPGHQIVRRAVATIRAIPIVRSPLPLTVVA